MAVDLASFENEAAGAAPIDAERTAFEVDSAPGRGVSPARKPQETGGLGFSIVPGRGGSSKKGAVPAAAREDSCVRSFFASRLVRRSLRRADVRAALRCRDWKSMQDGDSVYASSNKINEDEMEDKLDAEARAAGFEFVPENWQQRVFIMLDEPASGLVASLIGYAIMLLIITSSFCLVAETYPPLGPCSLPDMAEVWGYGSPEEACESYGTTVEEAQSLYDMFHAVEAFIIIVFTVEYGLRIALCTNRPRRNRSFVHYCTRWLNVIDLISIIPWWVELAFKTPASGAGVVRMLRLARVFRLLKVRTQQPAPDDCIVRAPTHCCAGGQLLERAAAVWLGLLSSARGAAAPLVHALYVPLLLRSGALSAGVQEPDRGVLRRSGIPDVLAGPGRGRGCAVHRRGRGSCAARRRHQRSCCGVGYGG